jgi:hypothetical protein
MTEPAIPLLPPLTTPPKDVDDLKRAVTDLYYGILTFYPILAGRLDTMIMYGLAADIPTADGSGRFYYATDTSTLYFDDGTWDEMSVDLSGYEETAHKDAASGYAGLDATSGVIKSLTFNAAPGNGAAWGIIGAGVCGETLAAKNVVYYKGSDTRWWKGLASASATAGPVAVALVISGNTAGNACTLLHWGTMEVTGWALTVGSLYYISTATGGLITTTAPSSTNHICRALGHALSATSFFFHPSSDYGEKAA